ncbi:MAG: tyrosine-type recombinase/integrase [Pseudomonadota bacterium]
MDRRKARKGIRPHGSGIQIDFVYQGRRYREKLAIAPTEANLKHADRTRNAILFDIAAGTLNLEKYFPNRHAAGIPSDSINAALDEFLKYKRLDCANSTLRDYKSAIDFHLRPKFGKLSFQEVSASMVRAWLADLAIGPKRKNNILIPLREIFKLAYRDGRIAHNPLDRIENLRNQPEDPNPFSPEEINTLLNASSGQVKNLFQFAFYTGLRTSELISLRWDDFDLVNKQIYVSRAKVRKVIKDTKTAAGRRTVKLLPYAVEALSRQRDFKSEEHKEIFLNPNTGKPWIDDGQIRKSAWYPLLRSASVTLRNPYQTRHTYASLMLTAGEDPFWVSVQMGHKNLQMTLKRYARWIPNRNQSGGEKVMLFLSQFSHSEAISV